MKKKQPTQKDAILAHLKKHKTIKPLQALSLYGCYRLSSIINRLREDGVNIATEIKEAKGKFGKTSYAVYKIRK